jgi:hypothetical protein
MALIKAKRNEYLVGLDWIGLIQEIDLKVLQVVSGGRLQIQ